ncbi:MAG: SpoIIE family protein phosphatase [Ilumatobacteraceae bacterium]
MTSGATIGLPARPAAQRPGFADSIAALRAPLLVLVVLVGYCAGALLAFELLSVSDLGAVFFAPAGLTVGVLLLLPRRRWWLVAAAIVVGEVTMDIRYGVPRERIPGLVLANLAEPFVGAVTVSELLGRSGELPRLSLVRRRDLFGFFLGAVVIGPSVAAVIASFNSLSGMDHDEVFRFAGEFWLGDSLGVLLVASLILAYAGEGDRRSLASVEGVGLVVATVALEVTVFWSIDLPLTYVVLVCFVAAGLRFGCRAVTTIAAFVGVLYGLAVVSGHEFWPGADPSTSLTLVKVQVGVFAVTGLVIAAEAFERESAVWLAAASAVRLDRETELVEDLQRALVPAERRSGDHFVAWGDYRPARREHRVGGDWYDVYELPDGRVLLSVGDVVGHGLESASFMGQLRAAVSALASVEGDPGRIVEHLNAFARRIGCPYATACVALFDPTDRTLRYALAGHLPVLAFGVEEVGAGPGVPPARLEAARSVPLGITDVVVGVSATSTLHEGAILALYTDGLVERPGEGIDRGIERLQAALVRLAGTWTSDADPGLNAIIARSPTLVSRRRRPAPGAPPLIGVASRSAATRAERSCCGTSASDGFWSRLGAWRDSSWGARQVRMHLDPRVPVGVVEERQAEPSVDPAGVGRREHDPQRRAPPVVRPLLYEVADVHDERIGAVRDRDPAAVDRLHFEPAPGRRPDAGW